jgi:hypothetical protein
VILVYTITLPKSSRWEAQKAFHLMEQLLYGCDGLVFRIKADCNRIEWQIVDLAERPPEGMRRAIQATYPEAEVQISDLPPYAHHDEPFERVVIPYRPVTDVFVAPIKHVDKLGDADPLAAITQTMAALRPGEQIIYSVFVTGLLPDAYQEGEKLIIRPVYDGSLWGFIRPQKVDRYIPEQQRVFVDKLERALYQSYLMIQIDTPYPERLASLLTIDNQTVLFDCPEFNGLRWYAINNTLEQVRVTDGETDLLTSALGMFLAFGSQEHQTKDLLKLRHDTRFVLEPRELAALWHLPHSGFSAANIAWMKAAQVELPTAMKGKRKGTRLGVNLYAGRTEEVYLPDEDRRTHGLVVGKTRVGKTNFLHHLVHQDIARGYGVVVFDPHNHLVQGVLESSIPDHRLRDVVVLDLANTDCPLPLNPMRGIQSDVALGRVLNVLHALYDDLTEMPQTADALENALMTLLGDSEATLRDVNRLFLDDAYRLQVLSKIDDDVAEEFWQADFGSMGEHQQKQISAPVVRRIRAFYRNKVLRSILCHPDGIDFANLIRQRKIILISLKTADDLMPTNEQRLIGSLLMARLQMAVMNGAAMAAPVNIYVDETQHFVTTTMDKLFSESQKFNASLTVANQYLKQLHGSTWDAVKGNIGMLVAFQAGGDDDARELAHYTRPNFTADDLLNLSKYQAAAWLRYNGEQQPAFSLQPLTPIPTPDDGQRRAMRIRQLSQAQYTPKSQAEVLAWLRARYPKAEAEDVHEDIFDPAG